MSDLVIIQDPTDNVKNLPKSILTYLYNRVKGDQDLEEYELKILDVIYMTRQRKHRSL